MLAGTSCFTLCCCTAAIDMCGCCVYTIAASWAAPGGCGDVVAVAVAHLCRAHSTAMQQHTHQCKLMDCKQCMLPLLLLLVLLLLLM